VAVFAVRFIKASLIYALVGVVMGLYMILAPHMKYMLVFTHAHVLLFGFMGMMIFGVAYHILPRFRGKPLYSPWLADSHLVLANMSVVGMGISWAINSYWHSPAAWFSLIFFAAVGVVSFAVFVFNMWKTIR